MFFRLSAMTFRAAAIAVPALLATAVSAPANAQVSVTVSYDNFHSRLAPYGTWSNHPRWGEVWHPTRVQRNFRPYYDGYWANTREYGWVWIADEDWGDVPYHYGRWVNDPRDGWLWVPGYVWAPSWVVWRSGGGNIGWFPMPPGDNYYGDGAYRDNFDNQYGYRDWYGSSFGNSQFLSLWVFVGEDHFGDRNYRNYALPQRDYGGFITQTRNITNYVTINNYVVNRSIGENQLQRGTNQRFQPVPASSVIGRNALVTQANIGRETEQRERKQHPIPANFDSAAKPVLQGRTNDGAPAANEPDQTKPETERGNPRAKGPQQGNDQAPQNSGARGNGRPSGNNGNESKPNSDQGAASGPPADTSPRNGKGQANLNPAPQRDRAKPDSNAPPDQVQESAPASGVSKDQGNAGKNKPRDSGKGDAKNAENQNAASDQKVADEKKAADDKKIADERRNTAGRGQN